MNRSEPLRVPSGPCGTCPYALGTEPGIWHPDEYELLPEYDRPMPEQPAGVFCCHYDNGDLCGGWLATHGPGELLAVRLGLSAGLVPIEVWDYATPVNVYETGAAAAAAGIVPGDEMSDRAVRATLRIEQDRARRGRPVVRGTEPTTEEQQP